MSNTIAPLFEMFSADSLRVYHPVTLNGVNGNDLSGFTYSVNLFTTPVLVAETLTDQMQDGVLGFLLKKEDTDGIKAGNYRISGKLRFASGEDLTVMDGTATFDCHGSWRISGIYVEPFVEIFR